MVVCNSLRLLLRHTIELVWYCLTERGHFTWWKWTCWFRVNSLCICWFFPKRMRWVHCLWYHITWLTLLQLRAERAKLWRRRVTMCQSCFALLHSVLVAVLPDHKSSPHICSAKWPHCQPPVACILHTTHPAWVHVCLSYSREQSSFLLFHGNWKGTGATAHQRNSTWCTSQRKKHPSITACSSSASSTPPCP